MSALTQDQMDMLKARDSRWRTLDLAIEVETELRQGRSLRILMDSLETDARAALDAFADINPGEVNAVIALQARVRAFIYAKRLFAGIMQQGAFAEAELRAQDSTEFEPNAD